MYFSHDAGKYLWGGMIECDPCASTCRELLLRISELVSLAGLTMVHMRIVRYLRNTRTGTFLAGRD